MPAFWQSCLLFFPLFLAINLVAAVPGRESLKEAVRIGVRHTIVGTTVLVVVSTVLFFFMSWMSGLEPLW